MVPEDNTAIVRRIYGAWSQPDQRSSLPRSMRPETPSCPPPPTNVQRVAVSRRLRMTMKIAVPDFNFMIEHVIAEGAYVLPL
ncbi:MAG: hypothetical protein M3R24_42130 [Chloroflexota bacterium]|nr:hypothetical protein [Chloroflexota bacterium]